VANKVKLAGLQAPPELDRGTRNAVRQAIDAAFVFGFRIVMLICVSLSVVSGVIAWMMIPKRG
jgi:hypothetical protein